MIRKVILTLIVCVITLATTFEAKADPLTLRLGAAADYAVLYTGTAGGNNIDMSNPQGGVQGNVGIFNGNLNNSGVTITGRVDFHKATGKVGHPPPQGGVFYNVAAVLQARNDSLAATAFWRNFVPRTNRGSILVTTVFNSTGPITVIDINNLELGNNKSLTLNGNAGDVFVINVYGKFKLNSADLLVSGGLDKNCVLYNVIGTGEDVALTGGGNAASVFGTILATERKVRLSPGFVTPRIIAGLKISIVSGADVLGPPVPPTAVPEPASMILLGLGLVGTAGAIRKRRKTNSV